MCMRVCVECMERAFVETMLVTFIAGSEAGEWRCRCWLGTYGRGARRSGLGVGLSHLCGALRTAWTAMA